MKILVCGASGFIGEAVCEKLAERGHVVVRGVRTPTNVDDVVIDFSSDFSVAGWIPRLAGVDVVVNAVGIVVESAGNRFDELHVRAPTALFNACVIAGVHRIVHISALGVEQGSSEYFNSKRFGEQELMVLPLDWVIVRPGLVYGDQGTTAAMFRELASCPVLALPAGGGQILQPLHIDDLAELVARVAEPDTPARRCIEAVGPDAITYREMLENYRRSLRIAPTLAIRIPAMVMSWAARELKHMAHESPFNAETWAMLQAGCRGDAQAMTNALGRPLKVFPGPLSTAQINIQRATALASWRPLLFRLALAFLWIASGLISTFAYPLAQSLKLLAAVGLTGLPALAALYGGATLAVAIGIATLKFPDHRLWWFQIVLVVAFTAIITIALPGYLIDPLGAVTKNVVVLALLLSLLAEERAS